MKENYSTNDTALLLVDLLNDFLDETGKLSQRIGPMLEKTGLIDHLTRLVTGARARGVKIFYVPHGLHEHSFDDVTHVHPRWQWAMENKVFWMGEWGSDFYPTFKPHDGDVIISRHRTFDSFVNTDMLAKLKEHKIEKVVLAGLTSHTCVESAGRHALEEGFHVTFLTDGVAEFTEEAHRAAIDLSYPTFGHEVTTIDEFLAAIDPA
ncbi:isochorismatase family cysteine hydrolase [Luteibacter aegosomatissinici]|uniref:isochorismatase family cysteine hydrolase n=1 Tax=Luteibacter aegosomatissinici TaxID=2911539 RepID=UPI001FFADDC4|nr:isochorismatase family cysteine hydrolase [Luteibacter aegosomatissinici]UPG92724.1 cysteine hydrolase [Luteibacter aegosomatissinici]